MTEESLLTAREVADWLKVHINTVKRMSDRGDIPFYRINSRGDRRYSRDDVKAYLATRGNGR